MPAVDTLQRIGAAVTPAVMVSACGLLALGLDNQAARMGGRLRDLAREFRELDAGHPRRALLRRQIEVLARRHGLYALALSLNYGALFAFVLTSALYLATALLPLPAGLPLVLFSLGVVLLGLMALVVLAALRLMRTTIALEAREVTPPSGREAPTPA